MKRSSLFTAAGLAAGLVVFPLRADGASSPPAKADKGVQLYLDQLSRAHGGFTESTALSGQALPGAVAYEMSSDSDVCLVLVVGAGASASCVDQASRDKSGLALSVRPTGSAELEMLISPPAGTVAIRTAAGDVLSTSGAAQTFLLDGWVELSDVSADTEVGGLRQSVPFG